MKKSISILLVLMFAISSLAYGEQKTKKSKTKATKAKPEYVYSVDKIDVTLDRLPPKYIGNDPRIVYSVIQGMKEVEKKNEFETTEHFAARISGNNKKPIIGKIGLDEVLAFRPEYNSILIKYNADAAKFTVDVKIEPDFRHLGYGVTSSFKSINLYDGKTERGEYIGSNAFGATINVTSSSYNSYCLLFDNYESFYSSHWTEEALKRENRYSKDWAGIAGREYVPRYSDYEKVYELNTTVNATPEEAKSIKEQIKALVIVKLKSPFIGEGSIYIPATFDSASSFSQHFEYLLADVQEIWIYNIRTGEIYTKKKIEVQRL
jgi:hypothetical protein